MRIWLQVDGEDHILVQGTDYTVNGNVVTLSEKRKEQLREWNRQPVYLVVLRNKSVTIINAYTSDTTATWKIETE